MSIPFSKNSGFSLVEILVGIAIIAGISTMTFYSLPAYRDKQALENASTEILSLLHDARVKTMTGEDAQAYGVHFEQKKAVLFATSYTPDTSISTVAFDADITLSATSLSTGGSDVLFRRGTGETSSYGTLTVSNSSGSRTRTISIAQSGFASEQ